MESKGFYTEKVKLLHTRSGWPMSFRFDVKRLSTRRRPLILTLTMVISRFVYGGLGGGGGRLVECLLEERVNRE